MIILFDAFTNIENKVKDIKFIVACNFPMFKSKKSIIIERALICYKSKLDDDKDFCKNECLKIIQEYTW